MKNNIFKPRTFNKTEKLYIPVDVKFKFLNLKRNKFDSYLKLKKLN